MLLKVYSNHFLYQDTKGKWLAYAPPDSPNSIGSWYKCNEETVEFIEKAINAGHAEIRHNLPGITRIFPLEGE